MANSVARTSSLPYIIVATATFTADGSLVLDDFVACDSITLQEVGNDGGGTLALEASNDGTNYAALPTAVSMTAAGLKSVPADGLGFRTYRLSLSGATNPSIVVTVVGTRRSVK